MTTEQLSFDFDAVKEDWRDIPQWEGQYQVSSLGRVKGCDRLASDGRFVQGCIKAQRLNDDGYLRVSLATGKRSIKKTRNVHELVLEAFIGPMPDGMQRRHLNGNRTDNRLWNLAYGTPAENGADTARHGSLKGSEIRRAYKMGPVLDELTIAAIRAAPSGRKAARLYGVSATHANNIRAGRTPCWR